MLASVTAKKRSARRGLFLRALRFCAVSVALFLRVSKMPYGKHKRAMRFFYASLVYFSLITF
jgi:ABC-type branched-subunit amino acid transport system permease subunit